MMQLDALAQAASDALAAAEERGFRRALGLVQAKLRSSADLCLVFSGDGGGKECSVSVEIPLDDDTLIHTDPVPLSDVLYEQYPTCEGSARSISKDVKLSLAEFDKIIVNWGKIAA